jgi:hypothetical protein
VSSKRRSLKKSSEFLDESESSSQYHRQSYFDDIDELHKSGSELSDDVDTVSSNNSTDVREFKISSVYCLFISYDKSLFKG